MKTLRPVQENAIRLIKSSLGRGCRRPMLQACTGFGKTTLASAICRGALSKGNRVIFCVPALSLVDQTVESFWQDGITEIGVLQADHPMTNYNQPIQVCSVQTLMRRAVPSADLVLIDEAHKHFDFYTRWMSEWPDKPFIGLSATPWSKGLGKHYDDLLIAATTQQMIDEGYLKPFRVYAPAHPDLKGVRTVAGDYHEGDLAEAMDKQPLVADIVETWLKLGEARPTLCFAVNRAHAAHLTERFNHAGVSTGYIDAYTSSDERNEIKDKFHRGVIQVVCNVGCLVMGVDWRVGCIILGRPTKSEQLFCQIIGRGLRQDGINYCLILDHSDTHQRLGFVTDIHHDKLDDGKKRRSSSQKKPIEKLPKECPSCAYLKPAGVHECPACGFAPTQMQDVETVDGELKELKSLGAKRGTDRQEFYSALLAYAESKGYASGWAWHTFHEYFGAYPSGLKKRTGPITPECKNFVKYKNIRRAKQRRKAA